MRAIVLNATKNGTADVEVHVSTENEHGRRARRHVGTLIIHKRDFELLLSTLVMGADRVGSRLAIYMEHDGLKANLVNELVRTPWTKQTDPHPFDAYYTKQDLEELERDNTQASA